MEDTCGDGVLVRVKPLSVGEHECCFGIRFCGARFRGARGVTRGVTGYDGYRRFNGRGGGTSDGDGRGCVLADCIPGTAEGLIERCPYAGLRGAQYPERLRPAGKEVRFSRFSVQLL